MNIHEYRCGGSIIAARYGEQCATKLTEDQAMDIYRRREKARKLMNEARLLSNSALAQKFGISDKSVGRIINGHRWGSGKKSKHGDMTREDAELIREAAKYRDKLKSLSAEHSYRAIAEKYGISKSLIHQISHGLRWVRLRIES